VTYGAVFEVMPFDDRLVGFRVTGAELRRLIATLVSGRSDLPGLAGLRARVTCSGGALDVALLRPNGTPVRDDDRVLVATTDFLATGGDAIFDPITPPGGFTIDSDAGTPRDAVIDALRARGGTLREDELVDRGNPRWVLPGPQPVTCGG
jgi:2',3'-cyclic-nucleotide 2'-phosphodiesterase (5'-nucleotidase family)